LGSFDGVGFIDYSDRNLLDHPDVLLKVVVKVQATPFTQALQGDFVKSKLKEKKTQVKSRKQDLALEGKSLGLFSHDNFMRKKLTNLVLSNRFENFVYFLIFVSCVALVLDRPTLKQGSALKTNLWYLDITITTLFIVEMLAKIISSGFCFTTGSYLSDSWNGTDISYLKSFLLF
jgi:hypothetical protein